MSLKQRLQRQLTSAREMSERLLADFHTPDQWTWQLHPHCNHALWFAGHMGHTDNFLISLVAPDRTAEPPDYADWFGMGSQPTSDPKAYPPSEQVLQFMRERRQTLLAVLNGFGEQELARATPHGAPEFLPDFGSVFEMAVWHEGLHSGQLTVVRRALGHTPLFDGES